MLQQQEIVNTILYKIHQDHHIKGTELQVVFHSLNLNKKVLMDHNSALIKGVISVVLNKISILVINKEIAV